MADTSFAPGISLPSGFHFDEVKSLATERLLRPLTFAPPLGVLSNFQGTFAGKGFNLIFRPQNGSTLTPLPKPAHGPNDNVLELNLTTETLAFSPSLGNVPNRGMVQGDIFLNGVPYVQTINDVTSGAAVTIHFEPGLWIAVPATSDPHEPATFTRMGSIPHGTTINLQGTASPVAGGPPTIPPVDPTPFVTAPPALRSVFQVRRRAMMPPFGSRRISPVISQTAPSRRRSSTTPIPCCVMRSRVRPS